MRRALVLAPAALALVAAGFFLGRPGSTPAAAPRAVPVPAFPEPAREGVVRDSVLRHFEVREDPAPVRTLAGRLRETFGSLNDAEILHVRDALARLLEERPETAWELASLFEQETDGDVLLLAAQVLGANAAAMSDPAIVDLMVRIAESGKAPAGRGGALMVLMQLPRLDDRVTRSVLGLAGSAAEHRDLRASAIATVAAWMQSHPEGVTPLSATLLDVARSAADAEVRGHAIQAVSLLDRTLDPGQVESLAPFLGDADPRNRSLAALALGGVSAEARPAALRHLEGAIASEKSADGQRGMMIQLVRAGGPETEAALGRVRDQNPRLAADVQDYLEILKAERDPAKVWELKQQRELARGVVQGADDHTD